MHARCTHMYTEHTHTFYILEPIISNIKTHLCEYVNAKRYFNVQKTTKQVIFFFFKFFDQDFTWDLYEMNF